MNEPGCAVRLCLRSSGPSSLPASARSPTSLNPAAHDAPHTPAAQAAAAGAPESASIDPLKPSAPPVTTPEARFFSEFQAERARQLQAGVSDTDDGLGATGDPNDPAEDAVGEQQHRAAERSARRRQGEAEGRRDKERQLQQLARQNTRIRSAAEAEALGDSSHTADSSLATERSLSLAHELASKGLMDSISTRRYQSYLLLVQQQKDIEKNKYQN